MRVQNHRATALSLVLAAALLLVSAGAHGGLIADFMPSPASAGAPEFLWTGQDFISGPGAIGTGFGVPGAGDGELPQAQQNAPGLLITTPYVIGGAPGGQVTGAATTFYDATLQIVPVAQSQGFPSAGPADLFFGQIFQPLGGAIVRLWSTDPSEPAGPDVENPVLLLEAIVQDALITGIAGANSGAALSAHVIYTDGAILQAAGWQNVPGELSWSLLDIAPPLGVDGQTGLVIPFTANGVGQFSAVPEPATMTVLGVGALAMFRRRREG